MPPVFTRMLAERLASKSGRRVREAVDGEELAPGSIWVAPGDHHLTVVREGTRHLVRTHQGPPENFCRPSVDVLLRSLAAAYGPHVLAVILTGMGQDGFAGCERVRAAGGEILVQDKATSVVWGMPGQVATAGLADEVLPLGAIGPGIVRRTTQTHREPARTLVMAAVGTGHVGGG
jgi:two-component system chemotaxis response regulator CheB